MLKVGLLVAAVAWTAWGASAVEFRAVGGSVVEGGQIAVEFTIDNTSPQVYGWSYGVCYDASLLSAVEAIGGADTLAVKNGSPPDWDLCEPCDGGYSRGIIIDMMLGVTLPVRSGFRDLRVTFQARRLAAGEPDVVTAQVRPCHEEVCDPVTRAVWTNAEGTSTLADLAGGSVSILRRQVIVRYLPQEGARIPIDPETGDCLSPRTVGIKAREDVQASADPARIEAFALGMGFDPAAIAVTGVDRGVGLSRFNGGAGPDYFEANVGSACLSAQATISLNPPWEYIDASSAVEIVKATLSVPAGAYAGAAEAVSVTLPFVETCGSPAVTNHVLVESEEIAVRDLGGKPLEVVVDPAPRNPFIRGDANADGRVDVGDVVALIDEFFRDGRKGPCTFSKDANSDRRADLSDVVYLIGYMFQHAYAAPSAPYPACGLAPDQVEGDCLSYPPCAK